MTTNREMLSGRPFGGLGIMWRKSLGSCITIEKYDYHRLMALQFDNGSCKRLAVNIPASKPSWAPRRISWGYVGYTGLGF